MIIGIMSAQTIAHFSKKHMVRNDLNLIKKEPKKRKYFEGLGFRVVSIPRTDRSSDI